MFTNELVRILSEIVLKEKRKHICVECEKVIEEENDFPEGIPVHSECYDLYENDDEFLAFVKKKTQIKE